MPTRGEVLVAIINNLNDFAIARDKHWYRIPVTSAKKRLKNRWPPDWLALYQTKAFGDDAHMVRTYARVLEIRKAYRWQLLQVPSRDPKRNRLYYQLLLGPLQRLPEPIISRRWRILRFNSGQINEEMAAYCVPKVVENIDKLGGVDEEGRIVPRKIDLDTLDGVQQLGLFDDLSTADDK